MCDTFGILTKEDTENHRYKSSEIFDKQCPQFMAMGMTYDQYWYGDISMAKAYLEAYEIKRKYENFKLWLMGSYVYEAILDASPTLNALKPQDPTPYRLEPYPLTEKEQLEAEERNKKKQIEAVRKQMEATMEVINRKFKDDKKGG